MEIGTMPRHPSATFEVHARSDVAQHKSREHQWKRHEDAEYDKAERDHVQDDGQDQPAASQGARDIAEDVPHPAGVRGHQAAFDRP
jgi:hypothetical protein